MTQVHSFTPVSRPDARLLILGSMPGRLSLEKQQYYAHPRNAFWPIAADLFGFSQDLAYPDRKRALIAGKAALWDVLKACTRTTSLDSDIVESSIVPNDFAAFFAAHRRIRLICFNGTKAEQTFNRYVAEGLCPEQQAIARVRLPSTSPAHASLTPSQKLHEWRRLVVVA